MESEKKKGSVNETHHSNTKNRNLRVVIITALPLATLRSVCHISRFILGSIPVENSSMSKTDGFPMSAIASESFLWFPPESLLASRSAYIFKAVPWSMASILSSSSWPLCSPLRRPYTIKCSLTLSWESMAVNWGQTPRAERAVRGCRITDTPSMSTSPISGRTSPPKYNERYQVIPTFRKTHTHGWY